MSSSKILRVNLLEEEVGDWKGGAGEAEALHGANSGRKTFLRDRVG